MWIIDMCSWNKHPKEKIEFEWWEWSNHLSLMFIKAHVCKSIGNFIPDCPNMKYFMTPAKLRSIQPKEKRIFSFQLK